MDTWGVLKKKYLLNRIGLVLLSVVFIMVTGLPFEAIWAFPKIILLILGIYVFSDFVVSKTLNQIFESKINKILIFYLVVRSLSIVNAINIFAFFSAYQRFIFGISTFFIALFFSKHKKYVNIIFICFVLSATVNVLFDHLLYFLPTLTLGFLKMTFLPDAFEFVKANLSRGRIYFSFFNELSIPIFIYYFFYLQRYRKINKRMNALKRIIVIVSLIFVLLAAFITNWRIKILDYLFAFFLSILLFRKVFINKKILTSITIIILIFLLSLSILFLNTDQDSVVNRFLPVAQDGLQKGNFGSRTDSWQNSLELTRAYPLLGIGFGNFQYYFSTQMRNLRSALPKADLLGIAFFNSPHNIFITNLVEGGILGFGGFLLLIYYSLKKDFEIISNPRKNVGLIVFIIQFWTLILYGFVHPTDFNSYYFLFFLLRGSINGMVSSSRRFADEKD